MIFVTTGSTKQSIFYKPLLEILDRYKSEGRIQDDIVVQSGCIEYSTPSFKENFSFSDYFEEYIDNAEVIITADGAGTLFGLLNRNKKIIVVPNDLASKYGAPSKDLIGGFEKEGYLLWCRDITIIDKLIKEAKKREFKLYISPHNYIAYTIKSGYDKWLKNEK